MRTSPSYTASYRIEVDEKITSIASIVDAVSATGAEIKGLDVADSDRGRIAMDLTCDMRDSEHRREVRDVINALPGVASDSVADQTFMSHIGGKVEIHSKVPLRNRDDLSRAYTPGVARVCTAIHDMPQKAHLLTMKANTVAVVSDGTAVLGLGDIGPEAALPVMEGKALLFKEFAGVDKVNFFAGQSTSKIPAGEQFVQVFYTMALMHGGIGTPGHYMGWKGMGQGNVGSLAAGGAAVQNVPNPLNPPGYPVYMLYPIPNFMTLEDPNAWELLEPSESWTNILEGEYGRDCWPTGKHKIDVHHMYYGVVQNSLNQIPNTNAGIEATRKMDFVWGTGVFFDASRQYCDIVVPVTSYWEQDDTVYSGEASAIFYINKMLEPSFESKTLWDISEMLAEKLGMDPKEINPASQQERALATAVGASITDAATGETKPLLTITQEDIDAFGAPGTPQEGVIELAELKEAGIYKYPVKEGAVIPEPFAAFIADPEANPLATATGKFEICCPTLAFMVNSVGYSTISPIGKWQIGDPEQGIGTQTDEFPLLLWTPHSLRRAHSLQDPVTSLREAFPQECFMSVVDAEARGIETGDLVLMTSPHGKVLRPAKVLPTIVPGAVALQDGAWLRIDEESGIDLGGDPNILQAPKSSGEASQSWTGTLVQVEKYDGPLTLDPDKNTPIVMPVGIEE